MLTGKGVQWGGSLVRPEATGYGMVYFAQEMLAAHKDSRRARLVSSGSGNVAQYGVQKLLEVGQAGHTSTRTVLHDPDGIDEDKLAYVMELKNVCGGLRNMPSALTSPTTKAEAVDIPATRLSVRHAERTVRTERRRYCAMVAGLWWRGPTCLPCRRPHLFVKAGILYVGQQRRRRRHQRAEMTQNPMRA